MCGVYPYNMENLALAVSDYATALAKPKDVRLVYISKLGRWSIAKLLRVDPLETALVVRSAFEVNPPLIRSSNNRFEN